MLFKAALAGDATLRPPFWVMRQAGRYLPEYRALKEKYGFIGIVKNPEAAVEAALQPMRRFDFDCAIIFSDILAVSEALGFPYKFKDGGGIILERRIEKSSDIENIESAAKDVKAKLSYVFENAKLLRSALPDKAVFGFCGAPFTLAAYMVEGASSSGFPRFKEFFTKQKALYRRLANALEEALASYCTEQADCGIDAVQVFDSHACLIPEGHYMDLSGSHVARIFKSTHGKVANFLFAGGMSQRFGELLETNADAYSMDSKLSLGKIASSFSGRGNFCLQGNMDPRILAESSPHEVSQVTKEIIRDMRPYKRHIFNLGHGITPDAKLENVEAMCEAVKCYSDKHE